MIVSVALCSEQNFTREILDIKLDSGFKPFFNWCKENGVPIIIVSRYLIHHFPSYLMISETSFVVEWLQLFEQYCPTLLARRTQRLLTSFRMMWTSARMEAGTSNSGTQRGRSLGFYYFPLLTSSGYFAFAVGMDTINHRRFCHIVIYRTDPRYSFLVMEFRVS